MKPEGQAFDVFKLLIAAIVAVALLAVLLPIIGFDFFTKDPNDVAVQQINNSITKPSLHQLSEEVIFKEGRSLNATAIASKTQQLDASQVCVSAGEFAGDPNFVDRGNGIIDFVGGTKTVQLSTLCDAGNKLSADLENYALDSDWASSCDCAGDAQTCCLVALRKT